MFTNSKKEKLIEKIKSEILKHKIKPINDYEVDDYHYIMYEFMIITYSETNNTIDLAFNVSTRPDLSAFFTMLLTKIHNFSNINIMEVYSEDEEGKISTGETCIKDHQEKLKTKIVNEFVTEQLQTHYLKTSQVGEMC